MALDFPNSPTTGQIVAGPKGSFVWDGAKWAPLATGAIGDAPSDGHQYARQNAAWSQVVIPPAGGLVAFNAYTASQTITIPAGATKAVVELWGGTGGTGGLYVASAPPNVSGGTGAGGFLRKFLTGLVAGQTLVLAVGAAGAAGTQSGSTVTAGGNGGASSLTSGSQTISALTANGSNGSAGSNVAGATTAGTAGGTATGGDFNLTGQAGRIGSVDATNNETLVGHAGSTMYSYGADGTSQGGAGGAPGHAGNPGGCQVWWFT